MENNTLAALTHALDFGSARLSAISANIANFNTPGYKRKDASFDAVLQNAEDGDSDNALLSGRQTDPRHLALNADDPAPNPVIVTQGGGAARADGNTVDVDAEGARLAEAEIYYNGAAQMITGQFAALKYAITGGR